MLAPLSNDFSQRNLVEAIFEEFQRGNISE
jgi:hypothetical protein